jgi:cell division protease FtsH
MQLPTDQQFLATRTELLGKISGLLGGRAAEELIFGEVSTGAENDLERATAIARQMVCVYGMNDRIGLSHVAQRQAAFLANPEAQLQRDSSEVTAREIDEEVRKLLDETYWNAKELLTTHRSKLETIAADLLKRETLSGDEFYAMLGRPRPEGKRGENIGPLTPPKEPLVDSSAS